jgi:hypothetical protein
MEDYKQLGLKSYMHYIAGNYVIQCPQLETMRSRFDGNLSVEINYCSHTLRSSACSKLIPTSVSSRAQPRRVLTATISPSICRQHQRKPRPPIAGLGPPTTKWNASTRTRQKPHATKANTLPQMSTNSPPSTSKPPQSRLEDPSPSRRSVRGVPSRRRYFVTFGKFNFVDLIRGFFVGEINLHMLDDQPIMFDAFKISTTEYRGPGPKKRSDIPTLKVVTPPDGLEDEDFWYPSREARW